MSIDDIINHIRNRAYMSGVDRSKQRTQATQEVFTTDKILKDLDRIDQTYFTDSEQTFADPCCGDGALLGEALIRKVENGIDFETALSTIYGVDFMEDNVALCRERLLCGREDLRHIVEKNIVCHDALTYDYSFNGTDQTEQELRFNNLFEEQENTLNFNFMTSNPAFNIAETNNKAGTGGNTTLYKTATRHAFDLLEPNGLLLNITLKGIIPDLLKKQFSKKQTHLINLMDDIDVWPYNTCYFVIENKDKTFETPINGGLAAKIFSPNEDDCFPFVYYSGADSGMKGFTPTGSTRVVRKLPGKNNDDVVYDHTDVETESGWKFAFNVMESKKSYTVTEEPVRGGTICYIPTATQEQADKLKLFVENNEV